MRKILFSAVAVLAIAAAASAAIISAPLGVPGGTPGVGMADLQVPISVSGGEMIKSATINAAITGGAIAGLDRKAGTIFAASINVPDDPAIYTDSLGRSAVYSDFSLGFTDPAVAANGVLAVLHINTTGLAAGTYNILLAGTDAGDTTVSDANGTALASQLVAGSFVITPEPASLVLLGLAGLFIRRR